MTWDLLAAAHTALRAAATDLDDADWHAPTPCTQWNVSQVLRHAAGDQHAYATGITGEPGPGEDQFAPAPEPPSDPVGYVTAALDRSSAAFAGVGPDDPAVPTPWPGTMPAELVVAACALDAMVHAWDIAVATGRPSPLSPDYAARLLPTAPTYVEPLRAFYAPELPRLAGDDAAQALLRYVGRDPAWSRVPVGAVR